MVALTKVFLFAVAAAALPEPDAAVYKRDYPAVTNDLSSLSRSISILSTRVVSYTGGVAAALPVQSAESNVESQIKKTTTDTQNSAVVTAAQAQNVCNYFTNSLIPIIRGALNALVAKKTAFNNAGLQGTVQGDLSSLSSEAKALATALIAKAPATKKPCASSASSTVISLFNSAINQYK